MGLALAYQLIDIFVLQPFDRWNVESVDDNCSTAVVTSTGIISLMIHKDIRVDLTVDGAIRIFNFAVSIGCL